MQSEFETQPQSSPNQQNSKQESPVIMEQPEANNSCQELSHQSFNQVDGSYQGNVSPVGGKVCGAAFNTTPIYDAQGSLVGLQAPPDANSVEDLGSCQNDAMGYISVPPVYQYNIAPHPNTGLLSGEYVPYTTYAINKNHHVYALPFQQQCNPQAHQSQPQFNHYRNQQKSLLLNTNLVNGIDQHSQDQDMVKVMDTFDKCPTVCSLFAILCCPITLWCSLPALAYSICSYTDYRAMDLERYRRKSDIARHLVITACVVGLLLCVAWTVLAFFYYEIMLTTVNDIVRVVSHRVRSGT